jgi:hypothetical protein
MLAIDKANVIDAFKNVKDVNGVTGVQFDEAGNISNYTALKQAITNEFNALENPTDEDEEAYQDKIDYLDQYEETLKSYED